jgi:RNA polymerase sigma-70 factor (ECF subfamily)
MREKKTGKTAVKNLNKLTDIELVRIAVNGEEKAYMELMNRYKRKIEFIVFRIIGRKSEIEDLVQEIFTKAFTSLKTFKSEFAFSTWLYKIATNHCIDFLRKKRITTYSIDEEYEMDDSSITIEIPDWSRIPDSEIMKNQRNELIRKAIDALPEHYRRVIILRHFEDRTYEEIARILKLPLGTVKVHIFRARELLYKSLKDKLKNY